MKKCLFALIAMIFTPAVVFATSGQYVCKAPNVNGPDDVAAALNSMSCDTTKPITSLTFSQTGYTVVCCVQK